MRSLTPRLIVLSTLLLRLCDEVSDAVELGFAQLRAFELEKRRNCLLSRAVEESLQQVRKRTASSRVFAQRWTIYVSASILDMDNSALLLESAKHRSHRR